MDRTKVVIIGAGASLHRAMALRLAYMSVDVISEEDFFRPLEERRPPTPTLIHEDTAILDELRSMLPYTRGSAKTESFANYYWRQRYPAQLPADQIKGPKGPRTKWGKLK